MGTRIFESLWFGKERAEVRGQERLEVRGQIAEVRTLAACGFHLCNLISTL